MEQSVTSSRGGCLYDPGGSAFLVSVIVTKEL